MTTPDWTVCKLSEVVEEILGGDWGKDKPFNGSLRCYALRGTDFNQVKLGKLESAPTRFVRGASVERRKLESGHLLVELSGGSEDQPTGRIMLVNDRVLATTTSPLLFSNFVKRLTVDTHKTDPDFFAAYWEFLYQTHRTRVYEKRTTGIRNFKLNEFLENEQIAIPPLPEQKAIAHVLRTVQQAKEATEKVIAATRQLKQSLMTHLFTYGPVPFDQADKVELKETEIGTVPTHWEIASLEETCKLTSGGTPSKKKQEYWAGPIPWASPKDMKAPRLWNTEDHISEEGLREGSRLAPPGTIFIVVRGMILAKNIPVALAMVPMAFNQDMKAIIPSKNIMPDYLLYAIGQLKRSLTKEIGTSAHGTRRIGTTAIEKLRIPLPSLSEQNDIVAMLSAIDKRMTSDQTTLEALTVLFQSALHHLMTGKVRVPVNTDQITAEAV